MTCSQPPTRQELEKVADGCEVDGTFVRPVAVAPIREPGRRPGIRVVIAEGRNREVGLHLHPGNGLHNTVDPLACRSHSLCMVSFTVFRKVSGHPCGRVVFGLPQYPN